MHDETLLLSFGHIFYYREKHLLVSLRNETTVSVNVSSYQRKDNTKV